MYFIQISDKPKYIERIFNIVRLEQDKIILPIKNEKKVSEAEQIRVAKKVDKILKKANSKKVILSNKAKKLDVFINYLYTNRYDIVNGKWLFEVISKDCVDYVVNKKNMKKEETYLSIMVNDLNDIILENIKKLVKEYKRVNIVTNHNEKFKKMEERLMNQDGIIVPVGSNKKKSLNKSNIILNVDFPSELINKYTINENAIIINLRGNVVINKKRFNGININDFDISLNRTDEIEYEKQTKFKLSELYEAYIYKKQPYYIISNKIKKDKIRIKYLKGKNETI